MSAPGGADQARAIAARVVAAYQGSGIDADLIAESWEWHDPISVGEEIAAASPDAFGVLQEMRRAHPRPTRGTAEVERLKANADPATMAELARVSSPSSDAEWAQASDQPPIIGGASHLSPSAALSECVEKFRSWLYMPDPAVLHAVLATYVANHLDGDPLWLLCVGPPSSGKTEIVNAVSHRPGVHQAATITEAALLSGTPKKQAASGSKGGLLRVIGDWGIIALKDFTSVLAQNRDTRSQVLAALREIFDGSWTRHVGTDGGRTLSWSGKVGLIGGCTPTIDRHHAVLSALGDRFILLRLPDIDPEDVSRRAMAHIGREREMRRALTAAVDSVVDAADTADALRPLSEVEYERLRDLAIFAVRARSAVERDGYSQDVLFLPEPEGPPRFLLSLRRLMGGLESIGCDDDEVWTVLGRVALDSMPKVRRQLLDVLGGSTGQPEPGGPVQTKDAATAADLPTSTARRVLEDLNLLGLVVRSKVGAADNSADQWALSEFTRRYGPSGVPEIPDGP